MKTSTALILATLLLCATLLVVAYLFKPEGRRNPCDLNPGGPACHAYQKSHR